MSADLLADETAHRTRLANRFVARRDELVEAGEAGRIRMVRRHAKWAARIVETAIARRYTRHCQWKHVLTDLENLAAPGGYDYNQRLVAVGYFMAETERFTDWPVF